MHKKRKRIPGHKERAIVSDTLPLEVPLTFSNRGFAEFLMSHEFHWKGDHIYWRSSGDAVDYVAKLISGTRGQAGITKETIETTSGLKDYHRFSNIGDLRKWWSLPYTYKIQFKSTSYRDLSVPHTRDQLEIINFYETYKDLILYYCSVSPFSIRYPVRTASKVYFHDFMHRALDDTGKHGVEDVSREYEVSRSYFAYSRYNLIHKFYESYEFHHNEKKFNRLVKTDISKCFDSIYTHSIAWAILGKPQVKENLGQNSVGTTFAGQFDALMQRLNYNETNGIIIGPEFSRIFAEIILQRIDSNLRKSLLREYNLYNKKDYEICRYVDDYFIFCNSDDDYSKIQSQLQIELKKYMFYLNTEKTVTHCKPIITPISIAKQSISDLLDQVITLKHINDENGNPTTKKEVASVNASKLITNYKTILSSADINYRDVLNWTLSIVDAKIMRHIRYLDIGTLAPGSHRALARQIHGVMQFCFFIYTVEPRVNTTIKLCNILAAVIGFMKRKSSTSDDRHWLFKLIFDNVLLVIDKSNSMPHSRVETLYLLVLLSELGRDYWLDTSILEDSVGLDSSKGNIKAHYELDYFTITVLLFYMKDKVRYRHIRCYLEDLVIKRIQKYKGDRIRESEDVMLFLDFIACPYVSEDAKAKVINSRDSFGGTRRSALINLRSHWFTRWTNFNMAMELEAKKGFEVY